MKKMKSETKKLSIDAVTIRRLETELTAEQLKVAMGGLPPERPSSKVDGERC